MATQQIDSNRFKAKVSKKKDLSHLALTPLDELLILEPFKPKHNLIHPGSQNEPHGASSVT